MFTRRATTWAVCVVVAAAWSLAVSPHAAWAWVWPAEGPVLRGFSVQGDKYAAGQHRGIDVALDTSVVRAPASGEVTFAGQVPTHGLTVTIAAPDGYRASLTHLGALRVSKGASVSEGDPIADAGPSGEAEHDSALCPPRHPGRRERDVRRPTRLASAAECSQPSPGTRGAARLSDPAGVDSSARCRTAGTRSGRRSRARACARISRTGRSTRGCSRGRRGLAYGGGARGPDRDRVEDSDTPSTARRNARADARRRSRRLAKRGP